MTASTGAVAAPQVPSPPANSVGGKQWLRTISLIASNETETFDMSQLRIKFAVKQADLTSPCAAQIRVFNLSRNSANRLVQQEYGRIVLQCGYENAAQGVIFVGTIVQARTGRENAVDSFVDIVAADSDQWFNFGVLNASLAAGATGAAALNAAAGASTGASPSARQPAQTVALGSVPDLSPMALPRGQVLSGMAADVVADVAAQNGMTYFVEQGKIHLVPLQGYRPGDAVVTNAQTGMIGWPTQTADGIEVKMLLNPALKVGCKLQIDNTSIMKGQETLSLQGIQDFSNLQANVPTNDDGIYRIYVINHVGDTRGNDWYSNVICLSVTGPLSQGLTSKGQG